MGAMIVWLASYPRSGNSFLRAVLHNLYGRKSCTVYPSRGKTLPFYSCEPGLSLDDMIASPEWYLVKTHDLPPDQTHPAIYVLRDGRSSVVSYAHQVLSKQGDGVVDPASEAYITLLRNIILDRRSPFGTWSQSALAWAGRPRTALVRFEDMTRDASCLVEAVKSLELGWELVPDASAPTFDALHHMRPGSFRRGQSTAWVNELPTDLYGVFWKEHGEAMEQFGYHDLPPLAAVETESLRP
jgi:hypothetical protein